MDATAVVAGAAGTYVHWGMISISVTNLVVIGLMLVVFALALVLPLPGAGRQHAVRGSDARREP